MENDYSFVLKNHTPYLHLILVGLFSFIHPALLQAGPDTPSSPEPLLKTSGQITATAEFYHTNDTSPRYMPFSWTLCGNLSLNTREWRIPVSFILSEKDRGFRQAFNQVGVSPEWRWLR